MSSDDPEHLASTVAEAFCTTEPGQPSQSDDRDVPTFELPAGGYDLGEVIGRGGMGEVVAAHDRRIGREVAIKRMRSARSSHIALARFLREARIQARLDHPAIVPVHELGRDADGRPYFTMKRLTGVTLAERLSERGAIQPLLRAFAEVCLAIEFAHTRGVIHRDLKPSNIMLGDYGEVYVLDWGVARVISERRAPSVQGDDIDTLKDGTQTGDLLGTPGYMAPEQVIGGEVGPASDVYALGAILFEILTGEPLHPRGAAALSTTLTDPQQKPARRRTERNIAPELDLACHAALAAEPTERPTARALGQLVQDYLDGDRDVERRRVLAAEHLAAAHEALESRDPEARATAIHSAGRALALDPESDDAARLVTSLIVEPPAELPTELNAKLEAQELEQTVRRTRTGVFALIALLLSLVVVPWMQVRDWGMLVAVYGGLLVIAAIRWVSPVNGLRSVVLNLAISLVLSLLVSRVLGPFVITPIVLTGMFLALAANPALDAHRGWFVAWIAFTMIVPLALEIAGILAPTWEISVRGVRAMSSIFDVGGTVEPLALVGANILVVAAVAVWSASIHRGVREMRRRVSIQAWHLNQLLPAGGVQPDMHRAQ